MPVSSTASEIGPTRLFSRSADWCPDNKLAVAYSDSKTRLFTTDGKESQSLACSGAVLKVRFQSSSILATATMDSKIQIWDLRSSDRAVQEIILPAQVRSMEWSDNNALSIACRNGKLHVHELQSGNKTKALLSDLDLDAECAFWCRNYLVVGDRGGRLRILNDAFQLPARKDMATSCWEFSAHSGPIFAAATCAKDQILVTGGADSTVLFWDVATMSCIHSHSRRTKFISSISSHQSTVAVAGPDPFIDIFEKSKLVGIVATKPVDEIAIQGSLLACAPIDPGQVMIHKLSFSSLQ